MVLSEASLLLEDIWSKMRRLKRICYFLFLFSLVTLIFSSKTFAISEDECRKKLDSGDLSLEELNQCEGILSESYKEERRTRTEAIENITTMIKITTSKIIARANEIRNLEEEISNLTVKIARLDVSLDQLSEILVRRIAETYKKGKIDALALLLSSSNFSEFIGRYKYLRVIQIHDRKLMIQMETVRTNYGDQKTVKEQKQTELEIAKMKLEEDKRKLAEEEQIQKELLAETERSYQQILAKIAAEKRKLAGASTFGKPAEFKIWPEDNNYFNQTDKRWATMLIGGGVYYDPDDPSYMWKYGCAVTSMAMVLKKWGADIDPSRLSQSQIYRTDLIAWQDVPGPGGFGGSIEVVGHAYGGVVDWDRIDGALNSGNWVIVYVSDVGHYVVLLNKEGDSYKMHDPYFGPNLSFNSKYSKGAVDEMVIYRQ